MSSVFQNFFKKFLKFFFEAKIKPKRTRYSRPSLSNNLSAAAILYFRTPRHIPIPTCPYILYTNAKSAKRCDAPPISRADDKADIAGVRLYTNASSFFVTSFSLSRFTSICAV